MPTPREVSIAFSKSQQAQLEYLQIRSRAKGAKTEILLLEYRLAARFLEIMEEEENRLSHQLREGLGKQFHPIRMRGLSRVRKSLSHFAKLAAIEASPPKPLE